MKKQKLKKRNKQLAYQYMETDIARSDVANENLRLGEKIRHLFDDNENMLADNRQLTAEKKSLELLNKKQAEFLSDNQNVITDKDELIQELIDTVYEQGNMIHSLDSDLKVIRDVVCLQ